jgi:predicted nucleic acid-binding Zn finger protein
MSLPAHEIEMLSKEELTQGDIEHFKAKYDKRFVRAFRLVEEGKVYKYHFLPSDTTTWAVKGRGREYLVIPEIYCTCRSFYQDVVIARKAGFCYHLLAQKIAEVRETYNQTESSDAQRREKFVSWRRTD